jgi:thiosulfate dehydrogenase [quinone] large subunit
MAPGQSRAALPDERKRLKGGVLVQSQNAQQGADTLRWVSLGIAVLAAVWTLFHIVWTLSSHTADDYWGIALVILFILALALAFARFFQERALMPDKVEHAAEEPFPEPAISRFFLASTGASAMWFVVRMNVGAEWLTAGWEKVSSPAWGASGKALSGFVVAAMAKSSGPNPAVQGWYAWFLQHVVLPNAGLFSFLVTWGELAVGIGILIGALTGIAAGFGVLMNFNYLLSGTVSVNPVIGMFGLFLCISWRVCGWLGLDRVLLPALGLPWKPGAWFQSDASISTNQRQTGYSS